MPNLKEIKNSTLLAELQRRMKLKEIRFNYDHPYSDQKITGLISWNALDQYELDFAKIENFGEKETSLQDLLITSKTIKLTKNHD